MSKLEKALERVGRVCADQKFKLRARVPVDTDDDDVVIADGMVWAKERIASLEGAVRETWHELNKIRSPQRFVTQELRFAVVAAAKLLDPVPWEEGEHE